MSILKKEKPFYFNLTTNQIDDLILEHKLKYEHNVNFHFIVDPYDIQKYCYPLGITAGAKDSNKLREQLTPGDISDEQIAYDRLFNDKETFHFILDEHYPELIDFQMYYLHLINEHKHNLIKTFESFAKEYEEKFANSTEKILQLAETDSNVISLLISTCLNFNNNGMAKLNKLIEDKKIITSLKELNNSELENKAATYSIFKEEDTGNLAEKLYQKFLEIFDPDNKREYDRRLQNHYAHIKRDYRAIERILHVNKRWIEKNKYSDTKFMFLYLSNASLTEFYYQENIDIRSKGMKKYYNFLRKEIDEKKPEILDEKFNPHRVPNQIFLQILLRGIPDNDEAHNETERRLNIIKDHIENPNDSTNELSNVMNALSESYQKIINENKNLENNLLIENLSLFEKALQNVKEKSSLSSYKKLNTHLNDLLEEYKGREYKEELQETINSTFRILSNVNVVLNFINGLKSNKVGSLGFKGSDRIELIYQTVPIVIYHNNNDKTKKYKNALDKFITKVIDIDFDIKKESDRKEMLQLIDNAFKIFTPESETTDSASENFNDYLNLIILLLIDRDSEDLQVNLVNYRSNQIKLILTKEKDYNTAKSNLLYIATAVARRDEKYKDAEAYAKVGIEKYPNDPRFYHSLALVNYCKERGSSIDEVIENFRKAKEIYEKLSKNDLLTNLAYEAIISSLAHCLALQYYQKENVDSLNESRKLLKQLKKLALKRYKQIAEYHYTEAKIEYYESIQAAKEGKLTDSKYKIERASEAIKRHEDISNSIHSFTRKIEKRRHELFEK